MPAIDIETLLEIAGLAGATDKIAQGRATLGNGRRQHFAHRCRQVLIALQRNAEENMRINSAQEQTIRKRANRAVVESLGGKSSPAYKNMAFKVFSAFWRDFKNHFEIPRYGDLPKKKFEEGLRFIEMWQPSTSLKIEIDNVNRQLRIEEVI